MVEDYRKLEDIYFALKYRVNQTVDILDNKTAFSVNDDADLFEKIVFLRDTANDFIKEGERLENADSN